jgi:hypothetical protein
MVKLLAQKVKSQYGGTAMNMLKAKFVPLVQMSKLSLAFAAV